MVTHICQLLHDDLWPQGLGSNPMSVTLKVTANLNFFVSGSFHGSTEDLCSISQLTTHKCTQELTDVLFRRAQQFIQFRLDPESQAARELGFAAISGFLEVQVTAHVALRASWQQPVTFMFHSWRMQLICDYRRQILHVCAWFPGSSHNAYILTNSQVPHVFGRLQSWLLGGKGHPQKTWLMTPVHHLQCAADESYNAAHASTRPMIEQMISLLRMMFRCLDHSGTVLQYSL
ncbi:putative nuclease HARBI1 [Carcharodon carcharias]|uniref:putative nuclease HARBI1 n=1 Tax=Carcharodon carcharias TaxID=13397 RepID=UPI001B7E6E36|nr:putative nuclease HARBI1 [Carcharodon carcharias]